MKQEEKKIFEKSNNKYLEILEYHQTEMKEKVRKEKPENKKTPGN